MKKDAESEALKERLTVIAERLSESASVLEDHYWEAMLDEACRSAIESRRPQITSELLDTVHATRPQAVFEELANGLETAATCRILPDGTQSLMLAVPVLYWSANRQIGCEALPRSACEAVRTAIGLVMAAGSAVHVLPWLLSVDNMPRDVWDVNRLHRDLSAGHLTTPLTRRLVAEPVAQALSDCRYILAAVRIPAGQAPLACQASPEAAARKPEFASRAKDILTEALRTAFFGTSYKVCQPSAYYSALKDSDTALRGYSLAATVEFLCAGYGLKREQIAATLAEFSLRTPEGTEESELRIGLTTLMNPERILEGLVWPLYEDSLDMAISQATQALVDLGCKAVGVLDQSYPADVTEADGAMLFPLPSGQCGAAEIPPEDEVPQIVEAHSIN